jgi:ubiquinone/menaquinone biosynthesis C-methylase UbiE
MSFDSLAPHYRWMEWLLAGSKLQRCRTAFMDKLSGAHRILLLGEGHGRFLEALAKRNPSVRITCVDASSRMLLEAERRLRKSRVQLSVEWVHADVFSWFPESRDYDCIVTHFFLDCFTGEQVNELVRKYSACLKPEGKWLLADFCQPSDGFRRLRARAILWLMYRFFRFATKLRADNLAPPDASLAANGFGLRKRLAFDWGLLHADLWCRI